MKLNHIIHHGLDFFLLILILSLGLAGLVFFRFEVASQIAVTITMAIFYVFWGVLHHLNDHNLTFKVILEYISLSALITFILVVFLLRV